MRRGDDLEAGRALVRRMAGVSQVTTGKGLDVGTDWGRRGGGELFSSSPGFCFLSETEARSSVESEHRQEGLEVEEGGGGGRTRCAFQENRRDCLLIWRH